MPPSSPIPTPLILRQVNVQGVPPNAPLLPHALPGQATPQSHRPLPSSDPSRISSLHSAHGARDTRVPRSDDIHDCLETLGYLTKYPKLRAHFLSTRFAPALLHSWATAEDRTKEVNIFEIVERFTFTKYHPENIAEWAGVVMRHYGRKDDVVTKRQCGNLQCWKWETDEPGMKFICCPRCKYFPHNHHQYRSNNNRRLRYCSKTCFARAWPGHSNWCIELKRQRDREKMSQMEQQQRQHNELIHAANETNERAVAAVAAADAAVAVAVSIMQTQNNGTDGEQMNDIA